MAVAVVAGASTSRPAIDETPVSDQPAQDGQLFPEAAAPPVVDEPVPEAEPEVSTEPVAAAPRKRAATRKAAAPRKKAAAPVKKAARKTSR